MSGDISILVVDDESSARQTLKTLLEEEKYHSETAEDGFKALGKLEEKNFDIVLTDLRMPIMNGLELIDKAKDKYPDLPIIVMTAFGSIDTAVEAMQLGAEDYLTKPLNFEAVELTISRTAEHLNVKNELNELKAEHGDDKKQGIQLIGNSPVMKDVEELIEQVAPSEATILITGESGTGKELVAKKIHELSNRSDESFVELHCAALAENLLESELFGHEKGAFTGATSARKGHFEKADGGTLFLDEITEIPESTQVKLLRFLQQQKFERVGSNETKSVDVRILAASNRDIEQAVKDGDFREDLYFRLNVITVDLPPLRARRDDIPLLANHFADKYSRQNNKNIQSLDSDVIERLQQYDWPGNVRELENTIEHAVVLANDDQIERQHLPNDFGDSSFKTGNDIHIPGSTLEEIEKYAILKTYESTGGSTSKTADMLNVSVRKIQYKLNEYRSNWEGPDPST